jgi:Protein of unknown function (DUF3467)
MADEKKKLSLKIIMDEKTAGGAYSNGAIINFSESEFILDFVLMQPQSQQAKVVSRVIASPLHAKRLLKALAENVGKFEARFGEIKLPEKPENPVKFMQ